MRRNNLRKRDIIFEKMQILYTMLLLGGCFEIYTITQDIIVSVLVFAVLEVGGIYVFEQGYNLWCKDNDLEED